MSDAPCSTVATALLFGSIIFATTTLAARLWLTGLWTWKHGGQPLGAFHNGALDVSSLPSIYNLLHHSCIFGFILLYTYICENHPPFMHEEKTLYDRDEFLFCLVILAVVGVRSWRRNTTNGNKNAPAEANQQSYEEIDSKKVRRQYPDEGDPQTHKHNPQVAPRPSAEDEVLNRDQTEEWKGWMQFVFLLYHYMHAIEVYNGIRVLITCYVWLTGFGKFPHSQNGRYWSKNLCRLPTLLITHTTSNSNYLGNFSFFYKTNDYSLPRLLQMLWRLNFLVIFLCLTHGNSYILYYICPLHTFYFLMVYAVMYIGKERNNKAWWIRCKLGLLGLIIFVVWDNSNNNNFGVFQGMQHFLILSDEPIAGAPYGTMWEWYFRSFLDHWSALLGMVFALNLPVMSLFFRKLEARSFGRQWIGKFSVLAGMLYAFISWVNGPFMMAKEEYNTTNPYFGFVPLLLYVYIRNLTPTLRSHSMSLLKEIGQTTLETYAMQHHVWLTSNSKTLLVFLPKYPRLNMILVTLSFVFISRRVYKLTIVLRNILLPNDRQTCIRSMSAMAVVVSGFYFTAFVLCRMQLVSMISIALLSILCGGLLYQTVMDSTWFDYHSTVKKSKEDEDDDEVKTFADKSELSFSIAGSDDESIVAKLCPPMIGILFLIVLGSVWNVIVAAGASSVGSLPPECAAYANEGSWIRVNTCNESNRAMAYRDHNVASFGTCSPQGTARIWVWKEQASHPHCRFGQRGESKLRRMLDGRNLLFIGDSMTRNLYNASLRAMGVQDAGAYDATIPKHTDLHHVMWHSTLVNFKWVCLRSLSELESLYILPSALTSRDTTIFLLGSPRC